MSTITTDVPGSDIDDVDGAADALLKRWTKPDPATDKVDSTPAPQPEEEDQNEADTGEEAEDTEEVETPEQKAPAQLAADDHEVEVSVDGQTIRVPVKDLKRLFGQEASLTRKSQEVSTLRAQAAENAERNQVALGAMIARVKERYAPFKEVDWAYAAAHLDPDDYKALKAQAELLKGDLTYLETELDNHVKSAREAQQGQLKEAAETCVQVLTAEDSPLRIEGWNDTVYNEIRAYGMSQGIPAQLMDSVVDPVAISMMHKAMLFDRAGKTTVNKVTKAPKNLSKTPTNGASSTPGQASERTAMSRLIKTGDPEAAAAVLEARWAR